MSTATATTPPATDQTMRHLTMRSSTADADSLTVEAIIATDGPVEVFDYREMTMIDEVLVADGVEHAGQVPLLDSHHRESVDRVIGSVRNIRQDRGRVSATLHFSNDDDGRRAFGKAAAGHLTDVSAGYRVLEFDTIEPGKSRRIGGNTYTAQPHKALRITRRWQLKEVSAVAVGADPAAKFRGDNAMIARTASHYFPNADRHDKVRAISAGLMIRAGVDPVDAAAPDHVRARQARDAEEGHDFARHSMRDVCRLCLELEGIDTAGMNRYTIVQRALATASLADAMADAGNAVLMRAFDAAEDTTRGWCEERDVLNFKTATSVGLTATQLSPLARGGSAHQSEMTDYAETGKLARFAEQTVFDEQDIFDDNTGALFAWWQDMGGAARHLRMDLVYHALLTNAVLAADSTTLFHTDHANTFTTAMGTAGIEDVLAGIAKQSLSGRQLNLKGQYLIVPPDLRGAAATAVRQITTDNDERPLILRVEPRIGAAGVTHPQTAVAVTGTATNYYAATAGQRTITVLYRSGMNRAPRLDQWTLDKNGQWGMGFAVTHDVGIIVDDYRGLAYSDGTS